MTRPVVEGTVASSTGTAHSSFLSCDAMYTFHYCILPLNLGMLLFSLIWMYSAAIRTRADSFAIDIDNATDFQATENFPRNIRGSLYSTRYGDVTWNNDAWTLTTTTARVDDYHAISFTANGYLGISMAANGPFVQRFERYAGWPLFDQRQTFSTISGFFDRQAKTNGTNYPWLSQYGGDSVISGIPAWSPLIIDLGNDRYLDASTKISQLSNIALQQDYRNGLAKWKYTWTPYDSNSLTINVTYTAFTHKLHVNRAYVRLEVSPSRNINFTAVNVIDGFHALRTNPVATGNEGNYIYSAVSPWGVDEVQAWVYAGIQTNASTSQTNITKRPYILGSNSSIAQGYVINARASQSTIITKYVGVASTDAFNNPRSQARSAIVAAIQEGYNKGLHSHSQEWTTVLPRTSISDYTDPSTGKLPENPAIIEKSLLQVVSTFYLLMNTIGENAYKLTNGASTNVNGISVPGLLTDAYAGQRFWDQDVWMKPFLDASFPWEAKQITNHRVQQYPQSLRNAQTAYQSSKYNTQLSQDAAIYAWTSGRDANCTVTGPCWDYEYHLNGDIANSFVTLWAASGDTDYFKTSLFPIMQSISTLFSEVLERNGSSWILTNMTDPDEYANHVDNGGFTMPLIASVLENTNWFRELFGLLPNPTWYEQAHNLLIPTVGDISLEYSGMNGTIDVKQADVVLKLYPLDITEKYTTAAQLADLDYYAGRQSPLGPSMTYAIFSIGATGISPSGCSGYTYDLNSWSPYIRAPFFFFSENLVDDYTGNSGNQNRAYPFLTGHGGALQVDLYGYLGLRYSANFTIQLNPTLPPQIKHLRFPTFYHQGWPISVISNKTHTTLTRLPTSILSTANKTYATAPLSIAVGTSTNNYLLHLPPNTTITIPNNLSLSNKTTPGNILQCVSATSYQPYIPGQFPIAAIDGAVSTIWQPADASKLASITADLTKTPFQKLLNMSFDWAQAPPRSATVVFHNQSDPDTGPGRVTIRLEDVGISEPYDANTAVLVQAYKSNSSFVDLRDRNVWSGNYATLTVVGNQNSGEMVVGAEVAEWVVVGEIGLTDDGNSGEVYVDMDARKLHKDL